MLNPFFLQGSPGEQNLVQDLINEQIRMYGIDVYYIPRQYLTENTVIKEVIQSEFNFSVPIEAYVNSYEGYSGQGTLMSKFGIQDIDELTLTISKERYEVYIAPLLKNIQGSKLIDRPKEGDLIYFPLGDRIFEIKYVEHEKPFYQLMKNYVYELKCELFRYEDEFINTGVDIIDDVSDSVGYFQTLKLVGSGTTATATASIVNGGVKSVTVVRRGSGYKTPPEVKFSTPPYGGLTAVGIATMISNIVDFCEPDSSLLRVQGVEIVNAGYGYTVAPLVSFISNTGSGTYAIATIGDGIIQKITVNNPGSGYASEPNVVISPQPVEGEVKARAIIDENGSVSDIRIVSSGIGYTQAPTIIISDPVLIGNGSFIKNEKITGSISGSTAYVKSWDISTLEMQIYQMSGEFLGSEVVYGDKSNASYKIKSINSNDTSNGFADNSEIQEEFDNIVDFSESNPFGNP
jgi:hypothetical protein